MTKGLRWRRGQRRLSAHNGSVRQSHGGDANCKKVTGRQLQIVVVKVLTTRLRNDDISANQSHRKGHRHAGTLICDPRQAPRTAHHQDLFLPHCNAMPAVSSI